MTRTTTALRAETGSKHFREDVDRLAQAEPSGDAIAELAFELYVEGGRHDGHDVEHWLEAEQRLRLR